MILANASWQIPCTKYVTVFYLPTPFITQEPSEVFAVDGKQLF